MDFEADNVFESITARTKDGDRFEINGNLCLSFESEDEPYASGVVRLNAVQATAIARFLLRAAKGKTCAIGIGKQ